MKQWFENLAEREKKLVIIASVVLLLGVFLQFIWMPLSNGLTEAQAKQQKQKALLEYVIQKTAEVKAGNKKSRVKASGSISQIVSQSARRSKIAIARLQPQGNSLQVQVDEIAFNELLKWVTDLTERQGLVIESIDISQSDRAGAVQIRRLQVTKA